jgi:hypothetical protein
VASAAGIAYAKNNGYQFERNEGYVWADEASCKSAKPAGTPCVPMQLYFSTSRNDNFLAVGAKNINNAKGAHYTLVRTEAYCKPPPSVPPPGPPTPAPKKEWLAWPQPPPGDHQVASCPFPKSTDLTGFEYLNTMNADPSAATPTTGGNGHSADTWYPTASLDGKLYTPWTDGTVHGIRSGSGGKGATTGMAIVNLPKNFDPVVDTYKLIVENVSTFHASAAPYQGRYPCGSLYYKGTWWYGTYSLENPTFPPNPEPNCGNWCVQGPFCGFRWSTDEGKTWTEPRLNMMNGTDNLFGENAFNNSKVKFGAPHVVDFGRELEHSPDGKMYIIGHGASLPTAHQSWMQGDEVYLARVLPTIEAVNDYSQWEFFAGKSSDVAATRKSDEDQEMRLDVCNSEIFDHIQCVRHHDVNGTCRWCECKPPQGTVDPACFSPAAAGALPSYCSCSTPPATSPSNPNPNSAPPQAAGDRWVKGDISAAKPLLTWNNHTGVTTMTWIPAIKKFIVVISTPSFSPYTNKQFDTYFLESDSISGPFKVGLIK